MPERRPPRHAKSVLDLYRHHPHTTGHVRKADRRLAADLDRQGISLATLNAAFLLVTARRSNSQQKPTSPIRSLHYFLPAIHEVLENPLEDEFLRYLRRFNRPGNADTDPRLS